jgi:hypothetical protein
MESVGAAKDDDVGTTDSNRKELDRLTARASRAYTKGRELVLREDN